MKKKTSMSEGKITVEDIRSERPHIFHETKTKTAIAIQTFIEFNIGTRRTRIATPNNVSIFLSISSKEISKAKLLYEKITRKSPSKNEIEISTGRKLKQTYDYLEHVQSAIVAIYTAIESFANIAIPNEFKIEKKNSKGIIEIWDKKSIERWYTTGEKIAEVLPRTLAIESPKKLKIWKDFVELEKIRNKIIHQKTVINQDTTDASFISELMQPEIFSKINSGFIIINYFCKANKSHQYFPLGFGESIIEATVVESFDEVLEPIEK